MMYDLAVAIAAYHRQKYSEAIDILLKILEADKQNWRAWFYLAMAYADSGLVENGYKIMQVIGALCPDMQLKHQAQTAALELSHELGNFSGAADQSRCA